MVFPDILNSSLSLLLLDQIAPPLLPLVADPFSLYTFIALIVSLRRHAHHGE